jgi:chitin disaccharide deacetylase
MSELIVQGDDFGMCHAVNEGIAKAFTGGIVQQASMMVPCPWFAEAAAIAREHAIPVGMHQTLTCEWEHYRWRPLTGGEFHRTVAAVIDGVSDDDATGELLAQADGMKAQGLDITYLDIHMGMSKPNAYSTIAAATGAPFLYPGIGASLRFASIWQMSAFDPDTKRGKLLRRLERIAGEPGVHLIVTHPAVGSDELRSITPQDAPNAPWTEEYRISDLEILTDPEIRARIDDLGITLQSVASLSR